MTTEPTPAGWYPDAYPEYLRWYDGTQWTDTRRPVGAPDATTMPPMRRRFFPPGDEPLYRWVRIFQGVGFGGVALVLLLGLLALPLLLTAPTLLWILFAFVLVYMLVALGLAIKVYVEGKKYREEYAAR